MSKKLVALIMASVMCCAPATAFAEEVTAESVLEASQKATEDAQSMSMAMTINLDAALEMSSEDTPASTVGFVTSGKFDVKNITSPTQMSMTGTVDLAAMGSTQSVGLDMYMVVSEDTETVDIYMNTTDSTSESTGWQHQQSDLSELLEVYGVSSLEELNTLSADDLIPGMTMDWELEEQDSAYVLTFQLPLTDVMPLIKDYMAASGQSVDEEDMEIFESLLGGLVINCAYTVDKETYELQMLHIDFNDSDLTSLNALISTLMLANYDASSEEGASMPNIALSLNDFSVDCVCSYNDVDAIEIPADALATEPVDTSELMSEAMDSIDSLEE